MVDEALAAALRLPTDATDEEISSGITALLLSAAHNASPTLPLSDIYRLLCASGASSLLDPLNTLPALLPSPDSAARDILALIGECSPAKEVVIAVQEGVERVEAGLNASDEEDEESEGEEEGEGGNRKQEKDKGTMSGQTQLARLINLYASATPRLKLRRKSVSETLHPLLSELEVALRLTGGRASRDEGRALIGSAGNLVERAARWCEEVGGSNEEERKRSQDILKALLDQAITACAHCIRSSVAQRTFEACFPRLTVRSSVGPHWEEGEKVVLDALNAYSILGVSTNDFTSTPSTSSLVALTYSQLDSTNPSTLLSAMAPVLIASIQTNALLDESLAFLLRTLHQHPSSPSELPPDTVIPLTTVLPALASAHPHAPTRQHAFRVLSLLLSLSPPQLRLQLLTDLTARSEFPQMRVAAVGLVKETVLEALSAPSRIKNVFASPVFVQMFGPVLFRPSPPDLFEADVALGEFQDSQESRRLVECLALYYVVLQRDTANLTGIRDKDMLLSVERSLLAPLRSTLQRWMADPEVSSGHTHAIMPLVSLQMSLERVDAARAALQGQDT